MTRVFSECGNDEDARLLIVRSSRLLKRLEFTLVSVSSPARCRVSKGYREVALLARACECVAE